MDNDSPPPPASPSPAQELGGGGEGGRKPIVVILVGAPGSGKRTFCEKVMRAARRPWARVCQDSIANGVPGTNAQCLQAASDALKEGTSVFIDGCNLDRQQRLKYVKLGGMQADVHAVVLDFPAKLCISRSLKRSGHEGNVQGGKVATFVYGMLRKKELPKLSEGFTRIMFCQNEADFNAAVCTYCNLGPLDNLSSGCFGEKPKMQVGIMNFLKKIDPPSNMISDGSPGDAGSENLSINKVQNDDSLMEISKTVVESGNSEFLACDSLGKDVPTLAFPSISTSDFQFDHEKASDIIVERVANFLSKNENMKLVLLDLSHNSSILSLVKAKAASQGIDCKRFCTFVGDITCLFSGGNLRCQVIANAANWSLTPPGGVNAEILNLGGEALATATKEHAGSLTPGTSVAIPLPPDSPLFEKEGVTHVIHVLGPHMNPQLSDCLNDDYEKGCMILCDAYSSLFENFASIAESQSGTYPGKRLLDEISCGDQKMKRDGTGATEDNNKRNKGDATADSGSHPTQPGLLEDATVNSGSHPAQPGLPANVNYSARSSYVDDKQYESDNSDVKTSWGFWGQALYRVAMNPRQHRHTLLEITANYVVLNDAYPKAKKHVIILSRIRGLDSLRDVRKKDLLILEEMHAAGMGWAEKFLKEDRTLIFRLGFHSVPSMQQLHLHVISQDFNSSGMRNKRHWNSFTTSFFRNSVDVIEEISASGKATIESRKLLSMDLRCHRCRRAHPTFQQLKSHISHCRTQFPEHLLQKGRLVGPEEI